MESIQLGTSRRSAEQRPSTTDRKQGLGLKLKVRDHNFINKREKIRHTKSVRFQKRNKTFYFQPHHPVYKLKALQQEIGLQLVEVPNLPVALNNNKCVLNVDRFFHCAYMDTESTKP
jgi:hypothetical protein